MRAADPTSSGWLNMLARCQRTKRPESAVLRPRARCAEGLLFGDRRASINGIIHADNEEPDTGFADCIRDLRLRVAAPVIAPSEITTSTLRSFRPEVACLKPR